MSSNAPFTQLSYTRRSININIIVLHFRRSGSWRQHGLQSYEWYHFFHQSHYFKWYTNDSLLFRWLCRAIQKLQTLFKPLLPSRRLSMQCIWNFFATSHGKSPCDGLGGTVKRLAAKASLQRPVDNQILTAEAMFQYCKKEIHGINFVYLTGAEIANVRQELAERFLVAKTIPGTRGFHQFTPLSVCSIAAKRVSEEADHTLTFNFVNQHEEKINLRPAQFLICVYDEHYWLGMVSEIDKDHEDILVKFMHPHFPARSFRWPNRDDVCWVPNLHIVCTTEAPTLSTITARQYIFERNELERIRTYMDNHKSNWIPNCTFTHYFHAFTDHPSIEEIIVS